MRFRLAQMRAWPLRRWSGSALIAVASLALALTSCAPATDVKPPATTPTTAIQPRLYATTEVKPAPGSTSVPRLSVASLDPARGATQWQVTLQSVFPLHAALPVVSGDTVFAMSDVVPATPGLASELSGVLSAFRASDGAPRWQATLGVLIASPVVANDELYTSALQYSDQGAQSKWVYALRTADGASIWKTQIPGGSGQNDSITLADGVLYIASNGICFDVCNNAYLLAVRASDGKLLWKDTISGNLNISAPTVDHGVVFITFPTTDNVSYGAQPELAAYDTATGATLWTRVLYSPLYRPSNAFFVADGGIVYVGMAIPLASDSSRPDHWAYTLAALDGRTGAIKWQVPTSLYPTIMAHDAQTLYVQTQTATDVGSVASQTLAAYQRADGKQQWHAGVPIESEVLGVQSGALFSVAINSDFSAPVRLQATSASDGAQRWQTALSVGYASRVAPIGGSLYAITGDTLYVVVNGMTLYAVATTDGHILWRQAFNSSVVDIQFVA